MSFHPQIAARQAITQDGPAYPAHINGKTVALNVGIFEFKAGEKPEWTAQYSNFKSLWSAKFE